MKIFSYGSADSGPSYFKVAAKDGSEIWYGLGITKVHAQGRNEVRVWVADRITDRNDNYLRISYSEDTANGEYYPVRIEYTGNLNGYAPKRLVEFVYEDRTDTSTGYIAGSMVGSTKRLKTIRTKVASTVVKEYNLSYEYGQSTKRSRMISVQECGGDSVCLPPTAFTWSEGQNGFSAPTRRITSFGLNDGWVADKHIRMMSDVNGDGLPDIVGFGDIGVSVALNRGNGSFPSSSRWSFFFGYKTDAGHWPKDDIRMLADVTGDGLPDIVGFGDSGVFVSNSSAGFPDHLTAITDGLGSQVLVEYKPLTDDSVYTKGSGASFPVVDIQAPMYVVSRHTVKENAASSTSFIYDHQYDRPQ